MLSRPPGQNINIFCAKSPVLAPFRSYDYLLISFLRFFAKVGGVEGYPSILGFSVEQGASDLIKTTLAPRPYCKAGVRAHVWAQKLHVFLAQNRKNGKNKIINNLSC